jgi:uncharacterized protein Smg (DUF494 family)
LRDVLLRFIEAYRDLPVSRDFSLKYDFNKHKKSTANDELVTTLNEIKKDTTREDVKYKIISLRIIYRKELKKVNVQISGLMMYTNQNVRLSKNEVLSTK